MAQQRTYCLGSALQNSRFDVSVAHVGFVVGIAVLWQDLQPSCASY